MSDPLRCPFCESPDVETVGQWGGQMITRQCRCRTCNTYFEAIRDEFAEAEASLPTSSPSRASAETSPASRSVRR